MNDEAPGPGQSGEGGPPDAGGRDRGPRRRGRRGRGGALPFRPQSTQFRAPGAPPPRHFDEEGAQQANEIAAYEQRQMRQQNRGWRPPTSVGGFGQRPAAAPRPGGGYPRPGGPGFRPGGGGGFGGRPGGQGFRPPMGGRPGGGMPLRAPRGRPMPAYQDQVRRMTGG